MIIFVIIITSAMQSINGVNLKEHWAAQHCLHGSNSIQYLSLELTSLKEC